METVRNIVTLGLEARQKAGIKVRQPLGRLEVIAEKLADEYIEIIKDELNIKKIDYLIKVKLGINKINLDTKITPALKQEGDCREFIRAIQGLRKDMGFMPSDVINITGATGPSGESFIKKEESKLKKSLNANEIKIGPGGSPDGEEVKIDELVFKVKIDKM